MEALPHLACPLCGAPNQCAPARTGDLAAACWCTSVAVSAEALARVPEGLRRKACLCPACAAGTSAPAGADRAASRSSPNAID